MKIPDPRTADAPPSKTEQFSAGPKDKEAFIFSGPSSLYAMLFSSCLFPPCQVSFFDYLWADPRTLSGDVFAERNYLIRTWSRFGPHNVPVQVARQGFARGGACISADGGTCELRNGTLCPFHEPKRWILSVLSWSISSRSSTNWWLGEREKMTPCSSRVPSRAAVSSVWISSREKRRHHGSVPSVLSGSIRVCCRSCRQS